MKSKVDFSIKSICTTFVLQYFTKKWHVLDGVQQIAKRQRVLQNYFVFQLSQDTFSLIKTTTFTNKSTQKVLKNKVARNFQLRSQNKLCCQSWYIFQQTPSFPPFVIWSGQSVAIKKKKTTLLFSGANNIVLVVIMLLYWNAMFMRRPLGWCIKKVRACESVLKWPIKVLLVYSSILGVLGVGKSFVEGTWRAI